MPFKLAALLFRISIVFVFLSTFSASSQTRSTDAKPTCLSEFMLEDSIDALLLGEDHLMDNTVFKIGTVKQLYPQRPNMVIALEFPRIAQIYCTDFIESGSESAYKRLKSLPLQNKKDQLETLRQLRLLKENGFFDQGIELLCFDIGVNQGISAFHDLELALTYVNESATKNLLQYIHSYVLKEVTFDQAIALLRNELQERGEHYEHVLGSNYIVFVDALEAIEIANSSGKVSIFNDQLMLERERYLAKMIHSGLTQKQGDSKMALVFTGMFHTNLLEYDTLTLGYSFNYLLRTEYSVRTLSIVTSHYKKKRAILNRFYTDFDDLKELPELRELMDKGACDLYLVEKELLNKFPTLHARCDGFLIHE